MNDHYIGWQLFGLKEQKQEYKIQKIRRRTALSTTGHGAPLGLRPCITRWQARAVHWAYFQKW